MKFDFDTIFLGALTVFLAALALFGIVYFAVNI